MLLLHHDLIRRHFVLTCASQGVVAHVLPAISYRPDRLLLSLCADWDFRSSARKSRLLGILVAHRRGNDILTSMSDQAAQVRATQHHDSGDRWRRRRQIGSGLPIAAGELPFENAIKRTRAISGLTQQEFADHRGVSVKDLKEIERGIANLTVNTLNQIAGNFELDVSLIRKRPARRNASGQGRRHQHCEPVSMADRMNHVPDDRIDLLLPPPAAEYAVMPYPGLHVMQLHIGRDPAA